MVGLVKIEVIQKKLKNSVFRVRFLLLINHLILNSKNFLMTLIEIQTMIHLVYVAFLKAQKTNQKMPFNLNKAFQLQVSLTLNQRSKPASLRS